MNHLLLLFISCFLYLGHSSHSCVPTFKIVPESELEGKNRLDWSAEDRLSWNDFQAKPDRDSWRIAAITSSVIQYRYYCEDGLLNHTVKSIFLKDESWVKDKARTENYLAHEQLHFDITEVFARNLRKELSKRTFKCNQAKDFEKAIDKVLKEWKATQIKYDRETEYSLDKSAQKEWIDMIGEILDQTMKW